MEQQHHGITEDQKPKQLDVAVASQVQLFDAISHLPECQSFPNWASLDMFYSAQKKHIQGVPNEAMNGIFSLKFSASADPPGPPDQSTSVPRTPVPQSTSVILPSLLQRQFPISVETPLALLPCPHCLHGITVSMSYVGRVENPLDQFLTLPDDDISEREPAADTTMLLSEDKSNAPILAEIERQMMVRGLCLLPPPPPRILCNEGSFSQPLHLKR